MRKYEGIEIGRLFFALPLMCVGELTWKKEHGSIPLFIVSGLLLIAEISFVSAHAGKLDDRSMYLLLPAFTYAFVLLLRDWNPKIEVRHLGGISSAIYVMQFGVITVLTEIVKFLNISANWPYWLIWGCAILFPALFYMSLRKTKIIKVLF